MESLTVEQLTCLWFGRIFLGAAGIVGILAAWSWLFDCLLSFFDVKRAFLNWVFREVAAKRFETLRAKWQRWR